MRLVTIFFATLLAGLAAVPAALAADVTGQDPSRWVRVRANDGEVNKLTLSEAGGTVTVADAASDLTAGDGCTQVDARTVQCAVTEGEPRVDADLGDGDDEAVAYGSLVVKLDGGPGNDVLTGGSGKDSFDGGEGDDVISARDATRETVTCGAGNDSGEADLEDDLAADCEAVTRPLPPPPIDQAQPGETTGSSPAAPVPTPARSVAVGVKAGAILARKPGTTAFLPVDATLPVPLGTALDARHGTLTLTAAADRASSGLATADFTGGRFTVGQSGRVTLTTELRLKGGDFSGCRRARAHGAAFAARKRVIRKLWGSGHGRFRTRGRNSAATVRGTIWQVEDRCDGTVTRVMRGVVTVENTRTHRTATVRAGQAVLMRGRRIKRL